MSVSLKYILIQVLILVPFALALLSKKILISSTRKTYKKNSFDRLAKKIIRFNLIFIDPLIVLISVWGLQLDKSSLLLPLSGILMVAIGFRFGQFFSTKLLLKSKAKKTFIISSSISNHGFTLGGFLCYLFLGEKGLGLAFVFTLYFIPFVYLFIFPFAAIDKVNTKNKFENLKTLILNWQNMPFLAIIIALILNSFEITKPFKVNIQVLLYTSISLYYFSLGLSFYPSSLKFSIPQIKAVSFLAGIKFIIIPLFIYLLLYRLDINSNYKSIILIQSFMPAGIFSVATSILFNLDSKLASTLFVVNTAIFLVFIFPLMNYFY